MNYASLWQHFSLTFHLASLKRIVFSRIRIYLETCFTVDWKDRLNLWEKIPKNLVTPPLWKIHHWFVQRIYEGGGVFQLNNHLNVKIIAFLWLRGPKLCIVGKLYTIFFSNQTYQKGKRSYLFSADSILLWILS